MNGSQEVEPPSGGSNRLVFTNKKLTIFSKRSIAIDVLNYDHLIEKLISRIRLHICQKQCLSPCVRSLTGLSLSAQSIVSKQQLDATRLLFQLCMHEDPIEGPGRFGKILGIAEHLNKQRKIMRDLNAALRLKKNIIYVPKVLREPCNIENDEPEWS
ncbi:Protein CBG23759 [Caenorhabditis briggsae]|uniref:Protein CBG23759 n=1 Tax=Caenorhabditis briggsae TaxID=6238 RepID=A8WJ83_CAEBR|nr:Protein CBG23759 [Caenorhabditis briggsae]CAP20525.1 Protein CBG23759 [Caenorhabditis briggsae]